ncbi:MAG: hypothetical protein FJ278_22985 [Planctomycetes bacterium]|nr:hypothetical protein [Planctomycetota bacterium]
MRRLMSVTLAGVLWTAAAWAQTENLVKNPGFEVVDEAQKMPKDWQVAVWSSDAPTGKAAVELAEGGRTGKFAAKVRWFEGSKNVVFWPALTREIKGAGKFKLSFWFKGPNTVTVYASGYTQDTARKDVDYVHSKQAQASETWQQTVFEFQTSANAQTFNVFLRVNGDGVLFDDVSLEEIKAK